MAREKLINANGSQCTNLHRGRIEIVKSTTNLFKVIQRGAGNKTNRMMFNRKHKGSQRTRRILLLYLGSPLSRNPLVIFVIISVPDGKQS